MIYLWSRWLQSSPIANRRNPDAITKAAEFRTFGLSDNRLHIILECQGNHVPWSSDPSRQSAGLDFQGQHCARHGETAVKKERKEEGEGYDVGNIVVLGFSLMLSLSPRQQALKASNVYPY